MRVLEGSHRQLATLTLTLTPSPNPNPSPNLARQLATALRPAPELRTIASHIATKLHGHGQP